MSRNFRRVFRLDRSSRNDASASVRDELEHHIELCVEELVEEGWNRGEAQREALRQFGDLEATSAYCEDMQARRGAVERRAMSFDELWQDPTVSGTNASEGPRIRRPGRSHPRVRDRGEHHDFQRHEPLFFPAAAVRSAG